MNALVAMKQSVPMKNTTSPSITITGQNTQFVKIAGTENQWMQRIKRIMKTRESLPLMARDGTEEVGDIGNHQEKD